MRRNHSSTRIGWCAYVLGLITLAGLGAPASAQINTYWQGTPNAERSWRTATNWSAGIPTTDVYYTWINNDGIATIWDGDSFAPYNVSLSTGGLRVYGGTLALASHMSLFWGSTFAQNAGEFSGGNVSAWGAVASPGTIDLSGGLFEPMYSVSLGSSDGRTGILYISETADANVGAHVNVGHLQGGSGYVYQTGGSLDVARMLAIAASTGGNNDKSTTTGRYELSAGTVTSAATALGYSNASDPLDDGFGTFVQSGGSHSTGLLDITRSGRYEFTGGSLDVAYAFKNQGVVDFLGSSATVTIADNALVDLRGGSFANAGSATLAGGASAIVIVPVGVDPSTLVGNYNLGGAVFEDGQEIVIESGQTLTTAGTLDMPFRVRGTFNTAPQNELHLTGGLNIESGGSVSLSSVSLDGIDGSITNGSLRASSFSMLFPMIEIGRNTPTTFTQTGGDVTLVDASDNEIGGTWMRLGFYGGSEGTYNLVGGTMAVGQIMIGHGYSSTSAGVGCFNQIGGVAEIRSLEVGTIGEGHAEIDGGQLDSLQVRVGAVGGVGYFNQTGGAAVTIETLRLAEGFGARGTFTIDSGTLEVDELTIGGQSYPGNFPNPDDWVPSVGRLEQTGGVVTANDSLKVGWTQGGDGTYVLSDGVLNAKQVIVGIQATGRFEQSGGMSFIDSLDIAPSDTTLVEEQAVRLSGGEMNTGRLWIGNLRFSRDGFYEQTGGLHTVDKVYLGVDCGYRLYGGTLFIDGSIEKSFGSIIGNGSAATFELDAGGYANLEQTTLTSLTGVDFIGGAGSLVSFAAGVDPFAVFNSFTTDGLVHVAGQVLNIGAGQSVGGTGSINGDVVNGGAINPGNSPGAMSISGSYDQLSSGDLNVEIAGTSVGDPFDEENPVDPEFDRLIVQDVATLGGELLITLLDGFVPDAGDAFVIVQAESIVGQFSNAPDRVAFLGGSFAIDYNAQSVVLSDFIYAPVPAPTSLALLVGPAWALAMRRRVRRA